MKNDREKQIKYLMYLKNQLIKQTKKEIKTLQEELNQINGYKVLERKKRKWYGLYVECLLDSLWEYQ